MKANLTYTCFLICCILLSDCNKMDDVDGCLGCGIDTSIHEYTFHVDGNLIENCMGGAVSFKPVELYLYYKHGIDSLVNAGQTDENGNFHLTFKKLLPATYSLFSNLESFCLLKLPEDSLTFFLPGIHNYDNLQLQLNDSLQLNVFLDYVNHPLEESDTIRYRFEPVVMNYKPYPYHFKGPMNNHTLINTIKDKQRFVEMDEHGNPVSNLYWYIRRGGSWTTNSNWYVSTSKIPCVMRQDSVVINLN